MREIKFKLRTKDGWCGAFSVHQTGLIRTGDTEPIWQTAEELGGVLLQYTGLHDKNGKEIYEGDIVRSTDWNPEVYKVIFDRGAFCFTAGELMPIDCKYLEKFDVIGNIYENPELSPLLARWG